MNLGGYANRIGGIDLTSQEACYEKIGEWTSTKYTNDAGREVCLRHLAKRRTVLRGEHSVLHGRPSDQQRLNSDAAIEHSRVNGAIRPS